MYKVKINGKVYEFQNLARAKQAMEQAQMPGVYGGIPAGAVLAAKGNAPVNVCKSSGCWNWTGVTYLQAGTPFGTATGNTKATTLYGMAIEFISSVNLGAIKSGQKAWVLDDGGIIFKAGLGAEGAGYPITMGVTSTGVTILQKALIQKGYSIPAGATGTWGNQTEAARIEAGVPAKINSAAELQSIIERMPVKGTGTGGGGTGTGTGTGTGIVPMPETPPPSTDNTILYAGAALAALFFLKKPRKGKGRKKR